MNILAPQFWEVGKPTSFVLNGWRYEGEILGRMVSYPEEDSEPVVRWITMDLQVTANGLTLGPRQPTRVYLYVNEDREKLHRLHADEDCVFINFYVGPESEEPETNGVMELTRHTPPAYLRVSPWERN